MISILSILTGGGGVKNPENLTDVICTWPLKAGACEGSEQSIDYRGRRRRTLNLRENKRATRQWIDMNKHLPAACMK